jgi:hypothetical protein
MGTFLGSSSPQERFFIPPWNLAPFACWPLIGACPYWIGKAIFVPLQSECLEWKPKIQT